VAHSDFLIEKWIGKASVTSRVVEYIGQVSFPAFDIPENSPCNDYQK